ncbi:MAG: acetyl-CoA carboxylase biotin carboxyl carrier protein [Lentisphaeria bacterium]
MDITEIAEISRLMEKYGITEFNAETEGHKIQIKRDLAPVQVAMPMSYTQPMASPTMPVAVAPESAAPAIKGEFIESPIVGTFYISPGPDQPSFVKVGDVVSEDTVVCIVEAMKVMNEIKAGKSGKILKIIAKEGTPVEYGEPLFEIG